MIKRALVEILGLTAALEILEKVNKCGKIKYKSLKPLASCSTINIRLLQLTHFGLLKHEMIRNKEKREEWYEITEKGRKVLGILERLQESAEEQ